MSLEDRIRTSVDTALDDLRMRVEADMRELVDQLVAAARQEREEAVNVARRQAFDEAWESAHRDAADLSARAKAVSGQEIAEARTEERAAAERRLQEALVAAELRCLEERRAADARAARDHDEIREASARRLAAVEHRQSRLLDTIRGLDGATTLSDVLDALGVAIGREATRVAVLVVRNDRLVGWSLSGFGPRDMHPKAVDLAARDAGLAGKAVSEARAVGSDSSTWDRLLSDEPLGTDALAVPLVVGGRVVAVAYASQGPDAATVATGWRDAVEILVRHGALCLEALTGQRAAAAAPPRFWVPAPGPQLGETDGTAAAPVVMSPSRPSS
jgi:hypothetical protein